MANGSNGIANGEAHVELTDIDASKLKITLTDTPKPLPSYAEDLAFGTIMTDHMLVMSFDPATGWSAPEIKPYGPLTLDPSSSCFQYCTNVFEGMKAYAGPDGTPRLFRPHMNMARLQLSAERVALPPFNEDELLKLVKRLVMVDARWVPKREGHSLYIRPTMIGTRTMLGVGASDHALLYIILTPTGPFFPGFQPLSILAEGETVRSWPGGTGGYKLGLNYASGLKPQRIAEKQGYQQILWLLGEDKKITEVGVMNFFVVVKRDDGDMDVMTPPLDGTILPGLTRASCLNLTALHSPETPLPGVPQSVRLHTHERTLTMHDLIAWSEEGKLLEAFGVGTAAIVAPIGVIGFEGKDIVLPKYSTSSGLVGFALLKRLVSIQEGKVEWQGWSVPCQ